jgi:hypothetical protein
VVDGALVPELQGKGREPSSLAALFKTFLNLLACQSSLPTELYTVRFEFSLGVAKDLTLVRCYAVLLGKHQITNSMEQRPS